MILIAILAQKSLCQSTNRSDVNMRMIMALRAEKETVPIDSGMYYSQNTVSARIGDDSTISTMLDFYIYNRYYDTDYLNVGIYFPYKNIQYAVNFGFSNSSNERKRLREFLKREYSASRKSGTYHSATSDTLHDVTWQMNEIWYHASMVPVKISMDRYGGVYDKKELKIEFSKAVDDNDKSQSIIFPRVIIDEYNQKRFIEQLEDKYLEKVVSEFNHKNDPNPRGDTIYVAEWIQEFANGSAMLGDQFKFFAIDGNRVIFVNGNQFIAIKSKKKRKGIAGATLMQYFEKINPLSSSWKFTPKIGPERDIPEFSGI